MINKLFNVTYNTKQRISYSSSYYLKKRDSAKIFIRSLLLLFLITYGCIRGHRETTKRFTTFFTCFTTDTAFQKRSIHFPLKFRYFDIEQGSIVTDSISVHNWKHQSFENDSTYTNRELDKYESIFEYFSDSVKLKQRGIDNGIYIEFVFEQKEDKWFLVRIDNFSN